MRVYVGARVCGCACPRMRLDQPQHACVCACVIAIVFARACVRVCVRVCVSRPCIWIHLKLCQGVSVGGLVDVGLSANMYTPT